MGASLVWTVPRACYRTTFLSALPAVNPGVFRAGMLIGAPVCGLRPVRDFLERTINVPNPVTTTLSPFLSVSVIEPNTAWTASRAAFAVRLAFLATTSTRSAFVMEYIHLLLGRGIESTRKNFKRVAISISTRQCKRIRAFCQDINSKRKTHSAKLQCKS